MSGKDEYRKKQDEKFGRYELRYCPWFGTLSSGYIEFSTSDGQIQRDHMSKIIPTETDKVYSGYCEIGGPGFTTNPEWPDRRFPEERTFDFETLVVNHKHCLIAAARVDRKHKTPFFLFGFRAGDGQAKRRRVLWGYWVDGNTLAEKTDGALELSLAVMKKDQAVFQKAFAICLSDGGSGSWGTGNQGT